MRSKNTSMPRLFACSVSLLCFTAGTIAAAFFSLSPAIFFSVAAVAAFLWVTLPKDCQPRTHLVRVRGGSRDQVADLILTSPETGRSMVVCSGIKHGPLAVEGGYSFIVGISGAAGERWRVVIKMEELP